MLEEAISEVYSEVTLNKKKELSKQFLLNTATRGRTWNLLIRSQVPYPVWPWLQVVDKYII